MKHLLLCIAVAMLSFSLSAQKSKAIYAEALGHGLLGSINYEFTPKKDFDNLKVKVGLSYFLTPTVISSANYLIGKKNHFLEIGAGLSAFFFEKSSGGVGVLPGINGSLQYRYQHPKGFLLRIGYAPTFLPPQPRDEYQINYVFAYWPGLSLGYAF